VERKGKERKGKERKGKERSTLIGWHVLFLTLPSDVEGAFVHLLYTKVPSRSSLSLALAFNMSPENKGK